MKNSNDTIGNRTRDLPACSAVPQPTVLPRAPFMVRAKINKLILPLKICVGLTSTISIKLLKWASQKT